MIGDLLALKELDCYEKLIGLELGPDHSVGQLNTKIASSRS
jgi:hypothetical protein